MFIMSRRKWSSLSLVFLVLSALVLVALHPCVLGAEVLANKDAAGKNTLAKDILSDSTLPGPSDLPSQVPSSSSTTSSMGQGEQLYLMAIKALQDLDTKGRASLRKKPSSPSGMFMASLFRIVSKLVIGHKFRVPKQAVKEPFVPWEDVETSAPSSVASTNPDDDTRVTEDEKGTPIPVLDDVTPDTPAIRRAKAVRILEIAGYRYSYGPALQVLGDMYLTGCYLHPLNVSLAFQHYSALSALGDPVGHRMLGMYYAIGFQGVSERDYRKALVYMNFAAMDGDHVAEHVLAYWSFAGISVAQVCTDSAFWYLRLTSKIVEKYLDAPPGGMQIPSAKPSFTEMFGGVYGPRASGPGDPKFNAKQSSSANADLFTYYKLQADTGNAIAQDVVGKSYYYGTVSTKQDFNRALRYFDMAAKQYPESAPEDEKHAIPAAEASAYIGQMYMRGEGVPQSNETARVWFEKGLLKKIAVSYNGLGIFMRDGSAGLEKNPDKAIAFFLEASQRDLADGHVNLALMLMESGVPDWSHIVSLLQKAAVRKHVYAMYLLAEIYIQGTHGVVSNCPAGIKLLKEVAERADWDNPFIFRAQQDYEMGLVQEAAIQYVLAAEMGYELAQSNAAWLLEKITWSTSSSFFTQGPPNRSPVPQSIVLWNRAANQGCVDGRVKMGDFYYYGRPELDSTKQLMENVWNEARGQAPALGDLRKAANYYRVAAESEQSAHAMWNLAYMHEQGYGVEKDFHLAKRFYDLTLVTNSGAFFPVYFSLWRLGIKMRLETLSKSSVWEWHGWWPEKKQGTFPFGQDSGTEDSGVEQGVEQEEEVSGQKEPKPLKSTIDDAPPKPTHLVMPPSQENDEGEDWTSKTLDASEWIEGVVTLVLMGAAAVLLYRRQVG